MDAFDDGFGGEGEVEVDPAAEFLAKEQEELGEIGKLPVKLPNIINVNTHFKAKILVFILLVGNLLRVARPYKPSKKKRYSLNSLNNLYPVRTELIVSHSASIYVCIVYCMLYAMHVETCI